jgi:YfiH family protein
MKHQLGGMGYYTGRPVAGFFYGVGDREVDPGAGVDALLAAAGAPAAARVKQVHGARVVAHAEAASDCEADAIWVEPGSSAVIRVADCVPVILMNPALRRAAAVHAGWRGTYERIVPAALGTLGDRADVVAYIGPAIGGCCYEVGAELAEKFAGRFGEGPWIRREFRQPHLDLKTLNAHLLREAGVATIEVETACTFEAADLHSFRRDDARAGRLAAFVAVKSL